MNAGTTAVDSKVLARVRKRFLSESGAVTEPEQRLTELLHDEAPLLPESAVVTAAHRLTVELVGLGAIQRLLEDPAVSDVLVNGPGPVWIERNGCLEQTSVVLERHAIYRSIERLVGPLGLQADRSTPIVDARLGDGTRVAVVLPPLAVDGPLIAVRRHHVATQPLSAFGDDAVVRAVHRCIHERSNVVVFGATGSGKTTLLNSMAGLLPPTERIVTIEDTAELRLPGDHVVRLEARPGTADGAGAVGMRELVRAALRLRPDRLVIGEVRGAEALDMVWALSTGHRGSFSTCHADSPIDVVRRLETMCCSGPDRLPLEAVRAQVISAVDVVIGVARGDGGTRSIRSIHGLTASGDFVNLLGDS